MMHDVGNIQKLILARYAHVVACYLHGSSVNGDRTPLSDIDLIILVSDDSPTNYRERFLAETRLYDVYVYSISNFHQAMHASTASGNNVLVAAIADGIRIYCDDESICNTVESTAIQLNVPYAPRPTDILLKRLHLGDLVSDFSSIDGAREAYLGVVVELVVAILNARCLRLGCGIKSIKHAAELRPTQSSTSNQQLYASLIDALQGKRTTLLELAAAELRQIGGPLLQFRLQLPAGH